MIFFYFKFDKFFKLKFHVLAKKSFVLRIEEDTYKLLEKWSDDEFRSVNGQIEYLLHQNLIVSGRKKEKTKDKDSEESKNKK